MEALLVASFGSIYSFRRDPMKWRALIEETGQMCLLAHVTILLWSTPIFDNGRQTLELGF